MPTTDLSTVVTQIQQQFLAALKGQAPTPEEVAIIGRCAQRIAQAGVAYVGASPADQTALQQAVNLDLATLANIGETHEIQAEQVMRQVAMTAINDFLAVAVKALLAGVAVA